MWWDTRKIIPILHVSGRVSESKYEDAQSGLGDPQWPANPIKPSQAVGQTQVSDISLGIA